ncbi:DUF1735 domain-containing protein [Pedobacter chinensis]|uniref:DUF1735 domain-containing protein n=1 Tax=Pedobacter chinensis TaxID=2282421 RepID=A0A369Q0B7_9SPHI|nr:DUF1735 domain-containing protein [Pedobacter chinensis]RDC56677.1 DUF1735 domain-containing protein [Pedobacter chinensis]
MKIFKLLIPALVVTTMLSSCLKNKFDQINPDNSPSVVEFANPSAPASETPAGSAFTVFPVAYQVDASVEASYEVQLSGPNPAAQDITVNIGVNPAAVTQLNTEKSIVSSYVPYVVLPSTLYTISTPTVTIPAGQRKAIVKVLYKTTDFSFTTKYALPIAITSTSFGNVSKNFGTILLNVTAKNQYDGLYSYKTSANTALLPNRSLSGVRLVTVGANSVSILPGLLANYTNEVIYTVNPATNLVTVSMTTLTPIATNPSSKYDPATKTFTLSWTSNGGDRLFEETFVYQGPRP